MDYIRDLIHKYLQDADGNWVCPVPKKWRWFAAVALAIVLLALIFG